MTRDSVAAIANRDHSDVDAPDLPRGWQWASGEVGGGYYTRWFQTEYRMGGALAGVHGFGGYDAEVYWDKGNDHVVQIRPITGGVNADDPEYGYPVVTRHYETAQAALDAVPDLIRELGGDAE